MTTRAKIHTRYAELSSPFGRDLMVRKFGPDNAARIVKVFGTYTRGKSKGLTRGFIRWEKCESGGWKREGAFDAGRVVRPGSFGYTVVRDFDAIFDPMKGLPADASEDQVFRALGRMVGQWNNHNDSPLPGFPLFAEWESFIAKRDAENEAKLATFLCTGQFN